MCGSNTPKTVEGVSIANLSRNPSRHIPWCIKARKSFIRHCVKYQLDFKTLKWMKFENLLVDINCNHVNVTFQCATRSRVETALRGALKKLITLGLVQHMEDGTLNYPEHLTRGVAQVSWDGDLHGFLSLGISNRSPNPGVNPTV